MEAKAQAGYFLPDTKYVWKMSLKNTRQKKKQAFSFTVGERKGNCWFKARGILGFAFLPT